MSGTEQEGRPKRRLFTFWRVVAVLALGIAGYSVFLARDDAETGPYVAVHEVTGIILGDPRRASLLRDIATDSDAKALMLRINSPGGTTAGSEELYEAIRTVAATKPVVAVMGEVAASGGYIAALGADHVVAFGNTLTGSIGVVTQRPDVTGLLDRLGIEIRETRSDIYKANPSPFSTAPPEVLAWEDALIADAYAWFRGLVAERRGLEGAALDEVANGRVFTGRQALEAGLIDGIGGTGEARLWLASRGVDPALDLRRREVPEDSRGWLLELLFSRGLGLGELTLDPAGAGRRLYSTMR